TEVLGRVRSYPIRPRRGAMFPPGRTPRWNGPHCPLRSPPAVKLFVARGSPLRAVVRFAILGVSPRAILNSSFSFWAEGPRLEDGRPVGAWTGGTPLISINPCPKSI